MIKYGLCVGNVNFLFQFSAAFVAKKEKSTPPSHPFKNLTRQAL